MIGIWQSMSTTAYFPGNDSCEGLRAIGDHIYGVAQPLHHPTGNHLVDLVVLDDEDVAAAQIWLGDRLASVGVGLKQPAG